MDAVVGAAEGQVVAGAGVELDTADIGLGLEAGHGVGHVRGPQLHLAGGWQGCQVIVGLCMVHGAWCMVHGARFMVHGAWSKVHGAWCKVHGAGSPEHRRYRWQ